jgi:pectate lyase
MNKTNLVILILIGAVIFVLGGGLGISYQSQKTAAELEKTQTLVKALSSKIISSIAVQGNVTAIDGKNITLNLEEENLTVSIKDDAKIYSFDFSVEEGKIPIQQELGLQDIKKGDRVNVGLKVSQDGQLEGVSVFVQPPPDKLAPLNVSQ